MRLLARTPGGHPTTGVTVCDIPLHRVCDIRIRARNQPTHTKHIGDRRPEHPNCEVIGTWKTNNTHIVSMDSCTYTLPYIPVHCTPLIYIEILRLDSMTQSTGITSNSSNYSIRGSSGGSSSIRGSSSGNIIYESIGRRHHYRPEEDVWKRFWQWWWRSTITTTRPPPLYPPPLWLLLPMADTGNCCSLLGASR